MPDNSAVLPAPTKDSAGREYIRYSDLTPRLRVELDGSWPCCLRKLAMIYHDEDKDEYYFKCDAGRHYLSSEVDRAGYCIGIYPNPVLPAPSPSQPPTRKYGLDGKVAVLYSPGYGAAWSSWNPAHAEEMIFDPEIVQLVLAGASEKRIADVAQNKWPDAAFLDVVGLCVHWIEPGTEFLIAEYDGCESIVEINTLKFFTA